MSHFSTVELDIKDLESLTQALISMGFKTEYSESPVTLKDWLNKTQSSYKANLVVRKASNPQLLSDFGFLLKEGKFIAQVDAWAFHSYRSADYGIGYEAFNKTLNVTYAVELIKRQAAEIPGASITCVREEGKTKVRVKLPTNKTRAVNTRSGR